jgi:ComF family protein
MTVFNAIKTFSRELFDFAFPPLCPACRERLNEEDDGVCHRCREELRPVTRPWCERCGKPFQKNDETCPNCEIFEPLLACARSSCRFEDVARQLVHELKFRDRVELARPLARMMYVTWSDSLEARHFDLVLPVPLHSVRQRERGYNQSELLARELATIAQMPLDALSLERIRPTKTQTSLDSQARWENVKGAFSVARREAVAGGHLLLIDDVTTTCATGQACAEALNRAGAASVTLLTFARA